MRRKTDHIGLIGLVAAHGWQECQEKPEGAQTIS